jgi:hypothetical protein
MGKVGDAARFETYAAILTCAGKDAVVVEASAPPPPVTGDLNRSCMFWLPFALDPLDSDVAHKATP